MTYQRLPRTMKVNEVTRDGAHSGQKGFIHTPGRSDMRAPAKSVAGSLGSNLNDDQTIATPARPLCRLHGITLLICCGAAACSNSADPGSIEQIVRALLN